MNWQVERYAGSAGEFHQRPLPDTAARSVWVFEVQRPALVLGSTQSLDIVDVPVCERAGVEVVRRRSGGGAVYLAPGDVTWIDVVVPVGDVLWDGDVGRSMWWLGELWAAALGDLGLVGSGVHRGGLVTNEWSKLVCFAGLGPGEVTVGGAKLVGISQRRTRFACRFQCAVYRLWEPGVLVELLVDARFEANMLPAVAVVDHPPGDVAKRVYCSTLPADDHSLTRSS